jgi:hypothetical protein
MRKTPWFDGKSSWPVREGVYERRLPHQILGRASFSYWNGWAWGESCHSAEQAEACGRMGSLSIYQSLRWRGLTEDPSK